MINHPASRLLDERGMWRDQLAAPNTSADVSPTAGQLPRLVGLGYASRLFRELPALRHLAQFSHNGDEVAFGTIGNASCAEGMFWEAINAIGLLRIPVVLSVWDDGYGISVPNDQQLLGGNLSTLLSGFGCAAQGGLNLYTVRGWEYGRLHEVYQQATRRAREHHIPAVVHVTELTQPSGHSTSGSHERYKPAERLKWEAEHDPLPMLRAELIRRGLADEATLARLEREAAAAVEAARDAAQRHAAEPIRAEARELADVLDRAALPDQARELRELKRPSRRDIATRAQAALVQTRAAPGPTRDALAKWQCAYVARGRERYGSHTVSQSAESPLRVPAVAPVYAGDAPQVCGFEILQANFDTWLERDARVFLFGEDVGKLGDVNQGAAGLQAKHGPLRVADTGIREATIVGQAIGMALRGLRPIAEIQYLDYVYYALMTLSDDLACLHWRTAGGQKAPAIIRTRGHRLEGIWHSGSPMGVLLGALRGMHVLVPRDMTRAAGFYNTLLRGDDPALVIETLNAYRSREPLPQNLADFTVPLGAPEILRPGSDVTLVTYGACCRVALAAAAMLAEVEVDAEVIDVQSLLPFDTSQTIAASLHKTGRLVVLDEDVPGGASAFILQQVLEAQGGYWQLDAPPRTITAQPHRPAYTSDGDFFSKPSAEEVFAAVFDLMHASWPARYP